jgi:hypothetical protein
MWLSHWSRDMPQQQMRCMATYAMLLLSTI